MITRPEYTPTAAYFQDQARMHEDRARSALQDLIRDAQRALDNLDGGIIRATVGGSVLNSQHFEDAERSLVRWWDAKTAAAVVEREDAS